MTPTLSRSEINRANAQHSTGPKTDAGKKRSSLNAMRHGLTGQILVLPAEELAHYKSLCESLRNQFQPKTDEEERLVQLFADTKWRIMRVPAIENNIQQLGTRHGRRYSSVEDDDIGMALATAAEIREQAKVLSNLALYEQRLCRRHDKILEELERVQGERRAHETQQAQPPKREPLPAENGFVFSTTEKLFTNVAPTPPSAAGSPDPAFCAPKATTAETFASPPDTAFQTRAR